VVFLHLHFLISNDEQPFFYRHYLWGMNIMGSIGGFGDLYDPLNARGEEGARRQSELEAQKRKRSARAVCPHANIHPPGGNDRLWYCGECGQTFSNKQIKNGKYDPHAHEDSVF